MAARKDVHRPSEISTADYRPLFSFSYPGMNGEPGINTALMTAVRTGKPQQEPRYRLNEHGMRMIDGYVTVTSPWGKLPFFEKANESGGCHICGAYYRHGDAYLHEPSGEVVLIGHICSGKMDLCPDRGDWTRRQRELAKLRKDAEYIKARAERQEATKSEAVEFLRGSPGLTEALETDHYISRDLKDKLWRYGSLSEKQVALAVKLKREADAPAEDQPVEIEPPAGRHEIEGEIVSTKWVDNGFGGGLKMLVQCGNGTGRYRLFGTVPAAINPDGSGWYAPLTESGEELESIELKGSRVRFTATVQPKERGFGFFSRPAGGEIVQEAS